LVARSFKLFILRCYDSIILGDSLLSLLQLFDELDLLLERLVNDRIELVLEFRVSGFQVLVLLFQTTQLLSKVVVL
jgi:hypothetical protein